jgi:ribonuclease P protein component
MLNKNHRLRDNRSFNRVYKNGRRINGRYILLFVAESETAHNRFGIVTSKKTGKAVYRNLYKRRLRAILEKEMDKFKTSYDVIIIARYNIGEADFAALQKDMLIVLRKAGLC